MMFRFLLTLTRALWRSLHVELRRGEEPRVLPLGLRRAAEALELLAPCPGTTLHDAPAILRVAKAPDTWEGVSHLWWHGFARPATERIEVELLLFDSGGVSAAVRDGGRIEALRELRIAGPGCELYLPGAIPPREDTRVPAHGRASRYAGALGGLGPLERLQRLRIALPGVSRLGFPLARELANLGVAALVLIDDDRFEEHHRPAIRGLSARAIGAKKVDVAAEELRALSPATEILALDEPLESPRALAAASACDLVLAAPDRPSARALAAMCARFYHRPLLDLGTGVFDDDGVLDAGADVRLLLPDEPHCLLCAGELDLERVEARDWRRTRAGSLASLNGLAISYALFLLERYVVGSVATSSWTRLRLDAAAELRVERRALRGDPACPLCAAAGTGDAGWLLDPARPLHS
jgi:hypothetical protein